MIDRRCTSGSVTGINQSSLMAGAVTLQINFTRQLIFLWPAGIRIMVGLYMYRESLDDGIQGVLALGGGDRCVRGKIGAQLSTTSSNGFSEKLVYGYRMDFVRSTPYGVIRT